MPSVAKAMEGGGGAYRNPCLDFTPGIYIYSRLIILFATTATITGKVYRAAN